MRSGAWVGNGNPTEMAELSSAWKGVCDRANSSDRYKHTDISLNTCTQTYLHTYANAHILSISRSLAFF